MREVVEQLKFFSDLGVTHLNLGTDDSPQSLEEIREETRGTDARAACG